MAKIIEDIKNNLSSKPQPSNTEKWEEYCSTITTIGAIILNKYFKGGTDLIEARPWGGVKGEISYKEEYSLYAKEVLSDDDLKKRSADLWRGVKMASQETWFTKEEIKSVSTLGSAVKERLVRLPNGDRKKQVISSFTELPEDEKTPKGMDKLIKQSKGDRDEKAAKQKATTKTESVDAVKLIDTNTLKALQKRIEKHEKEIRKHQTDLDKLTRSLDRLLRSAQETIIDVRTQVIAAAIAAKKI